MKRQTHSDDDDGKVIANMNVDGMPWFLPRLQNNQSKGEAYKMNRAESRAYMWGALAASFFVVSIFGLVFAALIVFMLFFSN